LAGLTPSVAAGDSGWPRTVFILFGSALIPLLFVGYLRWYSPVEPPELWLLAAACGLGGLVAAPIAAIAEIFLIDGFGSSEVIKAVLIEETCKFAAMLVLFRAQDADLDFQLDGMILGAAVGMGFGIVEDLLFAAGGF